MKVKTGIIGDRGVSRDRKLNLPENGQLNFSEEFQEAIVGHCIKDFKFFLKCYGKIKATWFTKNILLGSIFDQLCKAYDHYGRHIYSVEEFKNYTFFMEQEESQRQKYYHTIVICEVSSRNFDLAKIERQLTGFLRTAMFKESIEGAAKKYKNQGFDESYDWTLQRLNDIKEATFEDDGYQLSFESPRDWIKQQAARSTDCISTGCKLLDENLGGGLFRKETCAVMAPSNQGKTMFCITIARNAIKQGKSVLFYIHEGDPEEIRFRLLCSFMGIRRSTAFQWIDDPEMSICVNRAAEYISSLLTYVPYIRTGGMFVEDVISDMKSRQEERVAKYGSGYDIIIDDYPKKLRSRFRSSSKEGLYRNEVSEVYDNFNHLAVEINTHCFLAVQTNRTGLKINNDKMDGKSQLLGMEEIDEAFGIAQNMANIITLNRSPVDKKLHILRLNIPKSRNGETDIVVNTRTNYSCFALFGDKDMFDFNTWTPEIHNRFLASYIPDTNEKIASETIDLILNEKEGKINISNSAVNESLNIGRAVIGTKLEQN
jgi:replicative DNA helicase